MNISTDDFSFKNIETGKTRLSTKKKLIILISTIASILLAGIIITIVVCVLKNKKKNKNFPTYFNRQVIPLKKWNFYKNLSELSDNIDKIDFSKEIPNSIEVTIPHTWNGYDGQTGGSNYSKVPCSYQILLTDEEVLKNLNDKKIFIEFCGSNLKTTLIVNGQKIDHHIGGFGKFRFDITEPILNSKSRLITVIVDNSNKEEYYPYDADFTFFGGIYRDVNLIYLYKTSFAMDDYGSRSLYIKPNAETGEVEINTTFSKENDNVKVKVKYSIYDNSNQLVFEHITDELDSKTLMSVIKIKIKDHHLWNGRKDPYLYHLEAELLVKMKDGYKVVDKVESNFGFRTMFVNYDGFFLNGNKYQLRGVSRHQDRPNKGWAITNLEEEEDFNLIYELGANAVRLAHYQQNETVYDICDKLGIIIICEVPYITDHLESAESEKNIETQLYEMIKQNFNHPSVALWGVFNEISTYKETEAEINLAKKLYQTSKALDPSRQVYGANVFLCPFTSQLNQITDVVGYNLYGGWYVGDVSGNKWQIDEIRKVKGNRPLMLTEYGAEAILKYHSDDPISHDYTEEYQLYFHQQFYKIIQEEDLFASFVWNMFDFASDRRDEGGVSGMNNKGLVSYDRKTRKESFYFYKCYWNDDEKFVHVCGERFHDRATNDINVTILTSKHLLNNDLLIYLNNELYQTINKNNQISVVVKINLKNGENILKAVVSDPSSKTEITSDFVEFKKVDQPNPDYVFLNKTEIDTKYPRPEGNFSIYNTIGEIHDSPQAWAALTSILPASSLESMMHFIENVRLVDVLIATGQNDENVYWLMVNKLKDIPKNNAIELIFN